MNTNKTATARLPRLQRALRYREIAKWADRAAAMGREDIAEIVTLERLDASETEAATLRLIERVRAALLLVAFDAGGEDDSEAAA